VKRFHNNKEYLNRYDIMNVLSLREPKFMKDLHEIREKLAKMPREKYLEELKRVREKYRKELGHLYVE